jgi:hypothetical protein
MLPSEALGGFHKLAAKTLTTVPNPREWLCAANDLFIVVCANSVGRERAAALISCEFTERLKRFTFEPAVPSEGEGSSLSWLLCSQARSAASSASRGMHPQRNSVARLQHLSNGALET